MKNCLICKKSPISFVKKVKSPWSDFKYSLFKCHSWESSFFDINDHKMDREKLYNEIAPELDPVFKESPYWDREAKQIQKILGHPVTSALDVGCRDGSFLMHYPQNTAKYGVELSEAQASIAKKRGIQVYTQTIEETSEIVGRVFDSVSCYAVLEHIPDPNKVISSICKYVEKNGVLTILIPTRQSFKAWVLDVLGLNWHQDVPPSHLNFFATKYLVKSIEDRGFELKFKKYTTGGLGFNPFSKIPILGGLVSRIYFLLDGLPLLNRLPLYDHLYLYFKKT